MFDEKSYKWIDIYRGIAIAFLWIYIAAGVYAFIDNQWIGDIFDIVIADGYFIGSTLLLFAGVAIGYVQLVANMLIIQLLNNVQIIREKIENQ